MGDGEMSPGRSKAEGPRADPTHLARLPSYTRSLLVSTSTSGGQGA